MDRTVVLLGAGASIDAGIPGAVDMTEAIVRRLDTKADVNWGYAPALRYAVGAIIAHEAANGGDPFRGVDVEQLFSAVQMLSDRRSLEVAPFVAAWSHELERFGPPRHLPAGFDEAFRSAARGPVVRVGGNPNGLITDAVKRVAGLLPPEDTFTGLRHAMIRAMRAMMLQGAPEVEYLAPILALSDTRLRIATLNYDRTIEQLCESRGVVHDTGILGWRGGFDWSWDPEARVRLLKLHGSIDWAETTETGPGGISETRLYSLDPDIAPDRLPFTPNPAIVFGVREKLRPDGPFLAMLREFDAFLQQTERLVIVGYSFRDRHINHAIAGWRNDYPDGRIVVIDPSFPDIDRRGPLSSSFARMLYNSMNEEANRGERTAPSNLRIINEPATAGLRQLIASE